MTPAFDLLLTIGWSFALSAYVRPSTPMLGALIRDILGGTMHIRITTAGVAAVALFALTACTAGSPDTDSTPPPQEPTAGQPTAPVATSADPDTPDDGAAPDDPAASDDGAAPDGADAAGDSAALPDLTGQDLQSAQDQAQAAGFYVLTSHDALGSGRMQILDRNWTVCSQTPTAGDRPTDTRVDFGAVKTEESCP